MQLGFEWMTETWVGDVDGVTGFPSSSSPASGREIGNVGAELGN